MKIFFILSLAVNVLFAFLLLRRHLPSSSSVTGGGQIERKNGFVAEAGSRKDSNPSGSQKVFYEFKLRKDKMDPAVGLRVTFENAMTDNCLIMRSYPKVIKWSDNGYDVTFTTPEVEVTLKNIESLIKND